MEHLSNNIPTCEYTRNLPSTSLPVGIWWCTTITDPSLFKFHLTPASNEWMSGARKEGSFYNAVLVPSSSEKRKYFHGEGEVNSEEEQRRRTEEYECRKWRRKLKLQYFKRRNIVMESIPGKSTFRHFCHHRMDEKDGRRVTGWM